MDWFIGHLGFRLERISPADNPARVLLSGHGLQIELQRGLEAEPGTLRLLCDDPTALQRALGVGDVEAGRGGSVCAPNGTRIELVEATPALRVPPGEQQLVITHDRGDADWMTGRAGMRYRDLIPGRLGGRFIASQIRIEAGGPVPDSVHFHDIRFQLIYCAAGWVRVAYEDQGQPLVMKPGDCVLQPPGIRHRVLESSAGLEVIEIACPAEHDTWLDHELSLPTASLRPDRDFGGQSFVHHVAADVPWTPWRADGFEQRETDIGRATCGLAGVSTVRCNRADTRAPLQHDGEFLFLYVLGGAVTWLCEGRQSQRLEQGDSIVVPAGLSSELDHGTSELSMVEVRLPANP